MIYDVVSLEELDGAIDYSKLIFSDSETDGLYGRIVMLQVMQAGWDKALLVRDPERFKLMAMLNKNTVWHNAHYDLTCVQTMLKMPWIPEHFEDTFLLARIALPHMESYTLDSLLLEVLGFDPYKNENLDKKVLQKSNWSGVLTEQQKLYAALDVYHMPEVWDKIVVAIEDINYQLDIATVRTCLEIQNNGMPIDQYLLEIKLNESIIELDANPVPINVNSWQQVRKWLDVTKSDDKALSILQLAPDNGCLESSEKGIKAGRIRKRRKLLKLINFLEKYNACGAYLYGKLKPSARSGRLTSDDDNIQQIPRALKGVFGYAPDSGRVIIYADYAQLELRTIAAILNVLLMVKMFRQGEDVHNFTAQMLFGENFTSMHRLYSKGANFGLLYGGGVDMFIGFMMQIASVVLSHREASSIKTRWSNLWKEITKWQQEGIAKWRKGKLGSTPLGRHYKAKMMTDFLNIENQGAGADVSKLAGHYMNTKSIPMLREKHGLSKTDIRLCNIIHDSFIIDCIDNREVYEEAAYEMAKCMQIAWFEISKSFKIQDVPMPVDVRVGYNWGQIDSDDGFKLYQYEMEGLKCLGMDL